MAEAGGGAAREGTSPGECPHVLILRFETEQDRAFVIHSVRVSKGFSGRIEIELVNQDGQGNSARP